jgi:selenide,water dikinase
MQSRAQCILMLQSAEVDQLLLCDAQTSGGLLFAVDPSKASALLDELIANDVQAAEIGEFVSAHTNNIEVVV